MPNKNFKSRAGQVTIPMVSTTPEPITAEAVTIPAGAAAALVNFYLKRKPIYDSHDGFIGGFGDTSVVLTSTAFVTEVSSDKADADLANGEYWIDYVTGKGRGRKADGSVSMTATYSVPSYNVILETGDIEIGAVELKDGVTDNRGVINAANTARVATDKVLLTQSIDAGGNVLSVAQYNATAPTLADGGYRNSQLDVNGNTQVNQRTLQAGEDLSNNVEAGVIRKLASPTYSPLLFTNFGANPTLNVKASAGNVFSLSCTNTNAAVRYIQLHNTATVPAPGAVPLWTHLVPAGSEVVLGEDFFSQAGLHFTNGIAFATSTTQGTYTAATATEHFIEVHYI